VYHNKDARVPSIGQAGLKEPAEKYLLMEKSVLRTYPVAGAERRGYNPADYAIPLPRNRLFPYSARRLESGRGCLHASRRHFKDYFNRLALRGGAL